jgi:uncharacterized protein (TIGR04255 family)
MGVQFGTPNEFCATHFAGVHDLFKREFPRVVDQPRLPPQFETFGGDAGSNMQFEFGPMPLRNRLWFVSEDDSHLLQFQDDRLLLNWRKRSHSADYPRYGAISASFVNYLEMLSQHFNEVLKTRMAINQAEISYINVIEVDGFERASSWLSIVDFSILKPEGLSLTCSEVEFDDGRPMGRLTTEIQSAFHSQKRTKALRLGLTFRGAPFDDTIDSAKALIDWGREKIVNRFCAMTTADAHRQWGRVS